MAHITTSFECHIPEVVFLLTGKDCASQCEHNDFENGTPDRCLEFVMIATAEEEATFCYVFRFSAFVIPAAAKKRALKMTLHIKRVKTLVLSVFVEHDPFQNAEEGAFGCAIMLTVFCLMCFFTMLFVQHK